MSEISREVVKGWFPGQFFRYLGGVGGSSSTIKSVTRQGDTSYTFHPSVPTVALLPGGRVGAARPKPPDGGFEG